MNANAKQKTLFEIFKAKELELMEMLKDAAENSGGASQFWEMREEVAEHFNTSQEFEVDKMIIANTELVGIYKKISNILEDQLETLNNIKNEV